MSSAPSGLDVREYLYGSFNLPMVLFGNYVVSTAGEWLVTRARLFASAAGGELDGPQFGPPVEVVANACYEIEPNGAYRDAFRVSGQGGLFSVEFWFQARGTVGQSIQIFLTLPDFSKLSFVRPTLVPPP